MVRHSREEVIERVQREFALLDRLVASLAPEDWERPVPRPETREPWTVKGALAHITYWKANMARSIRKERRPPEQRGLVLHDLNHLIWEQWRDQPGKAVLEWHRQVQQDLLAALQEAPDEYFSGKDRGEPWPFDVDGHSAYHRVRDIEAGLKSGPAE